MKKNTLDTMRISPSFTKKVQAEIHAHMVGDKKTLLTEEAASAKRNLLSVEGHADTPADLIVVGNVNENRPCLDNGQTDLVTTSHMGQTSVFMGKGTTLGKKDTTLSHHHKFTRKNNPDTDKRMDEEAMTRMKSKMLPYTQLVL